ncbi:beta-1,4-galactosyltransferase 2-like isoform X2 [Penaeus japonicus]|uniref:beta-1,4-galactosyltransferase 2-like isoform X2 n=1 Tax=Penaeus japonicus TaxID=27405 RepID=UPI001C70DF36|nr:beta-1,4-galactosyltransferase 2-like isoform X2 [Penaeus japonicus]
MAKDRSGSVRPFLAWTARMWSAVALTMLVGGCVLLQSRSGSSSSARTPKDAVVRQERAECGRLTEKEVKKRDYLPPCPATPPGLHGKLKVREDVSLEEAVQDLADGVGVGGSWAPPDCVPRWSIAIIVPFRDRQPQVGPFLYHMHNFLQRQQLNYSIYIVEQEGTELFNRARLLNVGYLEALREGPFDCYAFHDIDMLPEDDRHLYHCSEQPRHLAVAASNHNYNLVYNKYFGGACLMTQDHLARVNGWSNIYWGWGGEDDDMWRRLSFEDLPVWRFPANIARYRTIKHGPQVVNNKRYQTLKRNTGRYPNDGLSTIKYIVKSVVRHPLYTHIAADIGTPLPPS